MHRRIFKAVSILTLTALLFTGCTSEASNISRAEEKKANVVDTGFTLSTVGSYDSADTAVVLSTDLNNKAVSFINMNTGKQYTLYYDGTTYVQDKYDGPMTISQIKAGDVVDVTFLKGKKKLASIKLSPNAWVYDDVYNYDLAGSNKTASIGSQTYSLPDGVVVLSEGRRVETGEVVSQDVVTISGIDHEIYSVNVDRGHGYLRLKNDQALLGGWIEVGNRVIRQITEDMLLVVPEGSYQVVLTNKNVGCVKDVTVERDKEVVLDVSDLEVAEDAVGKILFTVTPESAKVSVDGKPVDISKVVELPYGIHQVQAEASGYDTLTRHIQVGSEYATISFKLEETRKTDKNSVSDNSTSRIPWKDTLDTLETSKPSVSDNTLSSISENALGTSNSYKVYIDSPKNVEVYLDGNYIGLSPVRFTKTAGRHEITLKKSGYKTKTYTIYLENTKKDETYSFSELEKESSGSSNKDDQDKTTSKSTGEAPLPTGKVKFMVEPADAVITVATKTPKSGEVIELSCGTHLIKVEKEGYETYNGSITIEPKEEEQTFNFELHKKSEETEMVEVSFEVEPTDVQIKTFKVDGEECSLENLKLPCKEHKFEAEAEGYKNWGPRDIDITKDMGPIKIEFEKESESETQPDPDNPETPPDPEIPSNPVTPTDPDETDPDPSVGEPPIVNPGGDEDGKEDITGGSDAEDEEKDGLAEQKIEIKQNAHPIRKFFSSLFK